MGPHVHTKPSGCCTWGRIAVEVTGHQFGQRLQAHSHHPQYRLQPALSGDRAKKHRSRYSVPVMKCSCCAAPVELVQAPIQSLQHLCLNSLPVKSNSKKILIFFAIGIALAVLHITHTRARFPWDGTVSGFEHTQRVTALSCLFNKTLIITHLMALPDILLTTRVSLTFSHLALSFSSNPLQT